MNLSLTSRLLKAFLPYRRHAILVAHVLLMTGAYFLAFLLRFEFRIPADQWTVFFTTLPILIVIRAIVFAWFHLYGGMWRYVSMYDIKAILKAASLSSLLFAAVVVGIFANGYARSILVIDWVLCLALVGGVRLGIRACRESTVKRTLVARTRAVVVGSGDGGEMLIREIERNSTLNYEVVGLVDDDPRKGQRRIHGIEVLGTLDQLPGICQSLEIQEILIAIPSATREQQSRILRYCRESGVAFKSVPALADLFKGKAKIGQLQEVKPEDLLGREAVRLDFEKLRQELEGKRVLVTGAAGSIGSEICRQVAAFGPGSLILFDRAENSLYFLTLDLRHNYPRLNTIPVVGDIANPRKVEETVQAYSPEVVYHTAAYKHVPLMEEYPLEAIENNIFGTETVALAAARGSVKKFVFISTDKAVKPVGIMGMSKRMAECLLLSLDGGRSTFVAVRFGNVLGSDGSILPLFQRQIARGGPVTVTDAGASRYFMLPSEAAQLVLQAGAMGKGGEIFFLDMGEPVRILDMAQNLIRLSGLEPGRDVAVELIGLRPGERLEEELVMEQEELISSEHEKVFMLKNHRFDAEAFRRDIEMLRRLVAGRDNQGAVHQLKAMALRY